MSVSALTRTNVVVSRQDRQLLLWLSRWRFATIPQMSRRAGLAQQVVHRRCTRLARAGLLTQHKLAEGIHAAWTMTQAGYTFIGSSYSPAPPRLTTIEHGLAVVDVAGVFYEKQYATVWSERELASLLFQRQKAQEEERKRTRSTGKENVPAGPWTLLGYGATHTPDAVLVGADGRWHAVEIEISDKAVEKRLVNIVRSFQKTKAEIGSFDTRFSSVTYFGSPGMCRKIEQIAERLRAEFGVLPCSIQAFDYAPIHSVPVPPKDPKGSTQKPAA